jgi:type IV secretory pathway TraG/TraD family ATPase VirD4
MFRRKARGTDASHDGPYVVWGGKVHPDRLGPHYAVMGQNGSGKTLSIRMLMRSALAPQGKLLHRALVYDPKLDFLPVLLALGIPEDRIHILNPFDRRSSAWDVAADIRSRAAARQLAANLFPTKERGLEYFTETPRTLMTELIDTLRTRAPRWTLNDLVRLVASYRFVDVLARGGPRAQGALRAHITENARDTASNILSTTQTGIEKYETVAALWARADRPAVSLERWMDAEAAPSIVLLGTYPEASESLLHINRSIFQRCSELLLMKGEYPADHTWFILDELRIAGEFETLPRTLLAARSKHGHFVIGFQDIHGLRDVYGPDKTEELIGQCHNIAILRLSSPESMEWASRYFGSQEWWMPSYGQSTGEKTSESQNVSLQERRSILASLFRELRLPSRAFGLEGVFATPEEPPWHGHLTPSFLDDHLPEMADAPGIDRRASTDQESAPYTQGLAQALGVNLDDTESPPRQGYLPSLPE